MEYEECDQDGVEHKGGQSYDGPYNAEYDYVYSLVAKSQPMSLVQQPLDTEVENVFVKGLDIISVPASFKNFGSSGIWSDNLSKQ